MLINCTNHPYDIWNEPQRNKARDYGKVVDVPFPVIEPTFTASDIRDIVTQYAIKIEEYNPDAVLVAGEYSFSFMLVDKLLRDGVKVLCSCSKRITKEIKKEDGTNEKSSVFLFEQFREYEYY